MEKIIKGIVACNEFIDANFVHQQCAYNICITQTV